MFLADLHTHSDCSNDGSFPMLEMARAAADRSLDAICITDHCDIEKYDTGRFDEKCFDGARILREYEKAKANAVGTELLLGMELSGANHYPAFARGLTEWPGLDFIIGSVHNLRNMTDFCCIKYTGEAHCRKLLEQYVEEHIELLKLSDFDVLGHIGYPLRYMREQGFDVDLTPYFSRLGELFTELKAAGRGIEINTSGLRGALKSTIPSLPLLKLYRERGGEIITIGSDAHCPSDVGAGMSEALGLLREAGFRYFCIFRDRCPEFIKI